MGIVFFLRILGMLLAYGAMMYISNMYGAAAYGRYSISLTVWQFLVLIFSLGLPNSIVKLTADYRYFKEGKPQNQYLNKSLKLIIFSGILCSFILFVSKEWLALTVFKDSYLIEYFKIISYFIGFGILYFFLLEFIRGKKKFTSFSIFQNVLPYTILIPLLFFFKKYNFLESNIIFAYAFSLSILALILLIYYPRKNKLKTNYSYKSIFSLSLPLLFSAAFIFISNWTDIFMLGNMVSKKDVGIYNASYKLASIALVVINSINVILAPKISELFSKGKIDEINTEVQKATKLVSLITIPMVLVLIIFSTQLLSLFGPEFVEGKLALIIISIGLLFNALSGSVGQILSMTNHQKTLRNFTIYSAVLNIILNYFFIKSYGFVGAALASMISNIFLNTICVIYIKREFKFYTFFRF
ncbi:flippase [Formosa sp. L2A11]|uniref:flippase n=1 Tax=Formosa sp. L2A11 TaxID=2686363 RepID=UPI00131BD19B|nr:flippase [Formosa sp. L2A11]